MPTPSIRLTDNLRRAVRNSNHSIGDLARTGIEQALISDFIGVCWLCGAAIHRQERSSATSRDHYERVISSREDFNWQSTDPFEFEPSGSPVSHEGFRQHIKEIEGTEQNFDYHSVVSTWLAIPDHPVELCADCTGILEDVKHRRIRLTELPIPYLFRGRESHHGGYVDPGMAVEFPSVAYAADSISVWLADYESYQRRDEREIFWWAARNRQQGSKYGVETWEGIAKKSHAHRIGWGNPPLPVFSMALEEVSFDEYWESGPFHNRPPGIPEDKIEQAKKEMFCSSCGTSKPIGASDYCELCYYTKISHSDTTQTDCSGSFQPYVEESLRAENVLLKCFECGETLMPPEGYADGLINTLMKNFEAIDYAVPLEIDDERK